jgi:hypothetical protein
MQPNPPPELSVITPEILELLKREYIKLNLPDAEIYDRLDTIAGGHPLPHTHIERSITGPITRLVVKQLVEAGFRDEYIIQRVLELVPTLQNAFRGEINTWIHRARLSHPQQPHR